MLSSADGNLRGSLSAPPIKVHEETLQRSFADTLSRSSTDIVGAVSGRYRFQIDRAADLAGDRPFFAMQQAGEEKERKMAKAFDRLSEQLNVKI